MIQSRKRLAALLLALALSAAVLVPGAFAAEPEQPAEQSGALTRAQSAQQAAEAALQYGGATSVRYALWDNGEIVLSGGAGTYSRSENRALTEDVLYGAGSVSKVYTAAAMLRLVEAGKVDLDAPVTDYLPDFRMADLRYSKITVRMLLNHSSGILGTGMSGAFLLGDPDGVNAADRLLDQLAVQRLKADPGAYSVYCNDGFTLAQLVVEAVSGQSFTDFVRQELLIPMGLADTFTPEDDFDRKRLARIYLPADIRELPEEAVTVIGTGGLYATAGDLAAFGGLLTGADSPLSPASREAMAVNEAVRGFWPDESEDDALAYGLGWDSVQMFPFSQSGITALVKGGDTSFYHAGLVVLPEYGLSAAVVSSGGVSTYNELACARMLIDALAEKGVAVDESGVLPPAEAAEMPAELVSRSGVYGTSSAYFDVTVTEDGVLTLTYPAVLGGAVQTFAYASDGSFRDETGTVLVKLVEEQGETYLYQRAYGVLPGLTVTSAASYAAVKLQDNPLPDEVKAAWEARSEKFYLQLNEPYNSQMYLLSAVVTGCPITPHVEGYVGTNRIVDANRAEASVGIPGTGGRDWVDVAVEERDGVEYLTSTGGYTYVDSGAVPVIHAGPRSYCTIQKSGDARWHRVGDGAGLTMTVDVPEHGGFTVYDAQFRVVASSAAYGDTAAVLPEGGWVVFAGRPGVRFTISMTQ